MSDTLHPSRRNERPIKYGPERREADTSRWPVRHTGERNGFRSLFTAFPELVQTQPVQMPQNEGQFDTVQKVSSLNQGSFGTDVAPRAVGNQAMKAEYGETDTSDVPTLDTEAIRNNVANLAQSGRTI